MDELSEMTDQSQELILSTEDAWTILQNKDNISVGYINIKGRISSVSEIFRVNKDELFLMVVDEILNIMIMRKEFLTWNQHLIPGHDYLFIKFKPATLKKGVDIPLKVYMPGSKAELFSDINNAKTCSLKEWLEINSIDTDKLHIDLPRTTDIESVSNCKLVSYQGKIEKVISAEFGVYNLDGNILLYTSYLPASKRIVNINIGSTIIVYNVHHGTGKLPPRIHLYCCSKSTLQVVNNGPPNSQKLLNSSYIEAVKTWVYHTINTNSLNRVDCETLRHLYQTVYCLCQNLKREKYDVIRLLQSVLSTSCCPRLQPKQRNIIQEFFSLPHECLFKQVSDEQKLPNVITVESVLQLAYNQSETIETLKTKYQHSSLMGKDLSERLYWSYRLSSKHDTQEVILGWLELCTTTGHLMFCDGKNKINVLITDNNTQHNCDQNCIEITSAHCPFLQLGALGKILLVTSYCIVSERFILGQFSNIESLTEGSVDEVQHIPYLQFSMCNCHVFLPHKRKSSEFTQSKCSKKDCDENIKQRTGSKRHVLESTSSCESGMSSIQITESEFSMKSAAVNDFTSLRAEQRTHFACASIKSCAAWGESSKKHCEVNNNECDFSLSVKPINNQNGIPAVKTISNACLIQTSQCGVSKDQNGCCAVKRNNNACVSQSAQNGVSRNQNGFQADSGKVKTVLITHKESLMTETFRGQTRLKFTALGCIMTRIDSDKPVGHNDYKYEPIELVFQGPSVKWYDVILSSAIYEFDQLKFVDYKVPSSMQYKVKMSVQRSKARRTVTVPIDVHITKIVLEDHAVRIEEGIKEIEEILSTECKDSVISVIGQIVTRKHCESGLPPKGVGFNEEKLRGEIQRNLGVSMIGNQCVQLQLKSLTNLSEITVYMKLERTSYPLGLLPGSIVRFERLERKISKRGTVYCHFISVSSLTVLSFTQPCLSSEDKSVEDSIRTGVKLEYILDKLQAKDSSIFLCQGRIYQIISLKLECKCCLCGSVYRQSKCPSPACRHITQCKLSGKISFLLDDGSTVAKSFYILDNTRILVLFQLKPEELDCLIEEIQESGEIYISNFSDNYNDVPISMFLQQLCNSANVKTSWQFQLKPFYNQNIDSVALGDLEVRNVHVGDTTIQTKGLPYWTLECLGLQSINYSTRLT